MLRKIKYVVIMAKAMVTWVLGVSLYSRICLVNKLLCYLQSLFIINTVFWFSKRETNG